MDSCFFRFLAPELADALAGVRFDTVYGPAPGFWTFAFTPPVSPTAALQGCRFLLLRAHGQHGALLISPEKPVNPASPPAKAMWLRKRLRGRKVTGFMLDWPRRRLALELTSGECGWLLLSMEEDPVVLERLPDGFGDAPGWQGADGALADPACPRSLRRALEKEDPEDRDALLARFLKGGAAGFYMGRGPKGPEGPLPWPAWRESERFGAALEAALAHGRGAVFEALAPKAEDPKHLNARRSKRLETLEKDRKRLQSLESQHAYGEALAANLSALEPRAKTGPLTLEHPELGPLEVPMDPALTVLENMERFFRKAAKGRRGQQHVERLRAQAERGELPPPRPRGPQAAPEPERKGRVRDTDLHRFRSSDGFIILRGRNSAANHRLVTEVASPFDIWLHAEGGPGAHVLIKRDHPGQHIPERTLLEAAAIAGLASWQAGDAKARVMYAPAGEVRKIKGAALGRVRLDSAASTVAAIDPEIEDRLRISG